jgi:ankyrin repeat protein
MISSLFIAAIGAATAPAVVTAVKQGDRAALKALIAKRVDVNEAAPDGTTALLLAAERDDLESVNLLLGARANANAANRYGVTPLSLACTNGNAAIIEKLLQAGANLNATTRDGETPLMTAARTGRVEAVKTLLVHGADVNAKEQTRGQTALMWAAAENNTAAVTALVEARADVNARTTGGFTPLLFAVRGGSRETVRVLLDAGANANDVLQAQRAAGMAAGGAAAASAGRGAAASGAAPAGRGGSAAANAPANASNAANAGAGRSSSDVAQLLAVFNTGSRRGRASGGTSALVLAITNAHYELASLLLDRGADPNGNSQGWTALHQLAWTRRPPIQHGLPPPVETGSMSSFELAKKLLEKGANPNARQTNEPSDGARNILNRIGSTPFLQAAKLGDIDYMRLLLEHGADASITTEEGATPLMAAAGVGIWQLGESAGTNLEAFEAVKICFERGNDVNAVDANGDTALHGAAHRGANEVVQFLVEHGAKLDVVNTLGWTPYLIADGVLYPNTYNRHLDTAELMLKLGANPNLGSRRPVDLPPSESKLNAPALTPTSR